MAKKSTRRKTRTHNYRPGSVAAAKAEALGAKPSRKAQKEQSDTMAAQFIAAKVISDACAIAVSGDAIPALLTELAVTILREGSGGVVEAQDITLLRWVIRKMQDNRKTEAGRPTVAPMPVPDEGEQFGEDGW